VPDRPQSSIHAEGFRSLREGEEVEYEVEEGPDGRTKAINVTGPGGAAPQVRQRGCRAAGAPASARRAVRSLTAGGARAVRRGSSGCSSGGSRIGAVCWVRSANPHTCVQQQCVQSPVACVRLCTQQ
jgi:protein lin-28